MSLENAALIYKGNIITGGGSSQVSTMPAYSSVPVGIIVQYVGATTQDYTNGFFYKATANGWENTEVQENVDISANPTVQATDATLMSVSIEGTNYKVNSARIYDTMPSKADLIAMPNGTYFKTLGFYSKNDGAGGLYLVDDAWRRGLLILQTSPRKVLHALNFNGAEDYSEVPLVRYGVRPYMVNADVPWDTITPENTYASANSDIVEALYGVASFGANLVLPAGRFFFERPMLLNRDGAQVGLKGDGSVWRPANYQLSAYIAGTTLYFPFLTNGQYAVRCVLANVENVSIIGSPLTYNMSIDRTKTITTPNEVVTEIVKVVDGTEVKCQGLHQIGGKVQNVMVAQFWQGFYGESSNIYINNIYACRCHLGVNIGNDIKCIGVYGWDVHTCVRIRGSITSLTNTRVDSCVHALEITGGSGLTVTDLDGDYCTESLILVKSDNWQEIHHNVFTGIHGRCCTLKSYDSTQSNGVDIRTLQDTSGYGIIRVEGTANFRYNRLVINTIGNANPFDNNSNYKTPTVLITNDNYGRWIDNNIFEINEPSVDEDFLLKNIQAKSNTVNVTCRVDTQLNSFTFNGDGTIRRFAKINDATPSSTTVFSSNKTLDVLLKSVKPFRQFMTTQIMSAEGRMALGEGNDKFSLDDSGYYDIENNILYYGGLHPTSKTYGLVVYDYSTKTSPSFAGFSDLDFSNLGLYDGSPIIRSVAKYGDYLYVGVRSSKPNIPSDGVDNNSVWGAIVCVDSTDFSVVWTEKLNAKVTGIEIYTASDNNVYMAVACQMSYIQFYTINPNDPTEITLRDTQYTKEWQNIQPSDYNAYVGEHQHGAFCETSDHKIIYISCGFSDGFHLYDISNIVNGQRAVLYNWLSWAATHQPIWYIDGNTAFHTMDCVVSYPYFYATMAPGTSILNRDSSNGTTKHRMGLLTMDISNLNDMQASMEYISVDDMTTFIGGDPRPTCITKEGNYIFLNNGTEGVAIFDASNASAPKYIGTNVVKDLIETGGLYSTSDGYLLVGDSPAIMNTGTPTYEAKKYVTLLKIANAL